MKRPNHLRYKSQAHANTNNAEGPILNEADAIERMEKGALRLLRAVLTDRPRRTKKAKRKTAR